LGSQNNAYFIALDHLYNETHYHKIHCINIKSLHVEANALTWDWSLSSVSLVNINFKAQQCQSQLKFEPVINKAKNANENQ